jgi:hypothetical protein
MDNHLFQVSVKNVRETFAGKSFVWFSTPNGWFFTPNGLQMGFGWKNEDKILEYLGYIPPLVLDENAEGHAAFKSEEDYMMLKLSDIFDN